MKDPCEARHQRLNILETSKDLYDAVRTVIHDGKALDVGMSLYSVRVMRLRPTVSSRLRERRRDR